LTAILHVEDEPSLQLALGDALREQGWDVVPAGTVAMALEALATAELDLVLTDLRLPDGSGMEVLAAALRREPGLPVVVLTAYGSVDGAVAAIRAGAAEYLTKPFEDEQLLTMVRRHLELRRLRRRVAELEGEVARPLGEDPGFRKVVDLASMAAASDMTVLLLGETGTGKEVFARFVHARSPRRQQPFVAMNCAALPESLLESELFGHERGAFTGAVKQRRGRFEEADGGTLFLDEVADTSLGVQAKLLRALESQRFERLGSSREISVDVRLVAATKKDLSAEVAAGNFRDDLFYRLNVLPIRLPPLRERATDIPLLTREFCSREEARHGRAFRFAPETLEVLSLFPFPGNVRELLHLVQRLAGQPHVDVNLASFSGPLQEMAAAFERQVLERTLRQYEGHRADTSQALGISRKTLWEKLKAHGLE
jgi:DNA-binding NtrC family response regulator